MKLAIITNEAEVINVIEDIEEYDLSKRLAAGEVIHEITEAVNQQLAKETYNGGTIPANDQVSS